MSLNCTTKRYIYAIKVLWQCPHLIIAALARSNNISSNSSRFDIRIVEKTWSILLCPVTTSESPQLSLFWWEKLRVYGTYARTIRYMSNINEMPVVQFLHMTEFSQLQQYKAACVCMHAQQKGMHVCANLKPNQSYVWFEAVCMHLSTCSFINDSCMSIFGDMTTSLNKLNLTWHNQIEVNEGNIKICT